MLASAAYGQHHCLSDVGADGRSRKSGYLALVKLLQYDSSGQLLKWSG